MIATRCCPAASGITSETYRPPPAVRTRSDAALTAEFQESAASLTVTAEDGDRVTLSFSAAALEAATAESSVAAQASQLSVAVEGDLDVHERSDLSRLLRRFFRAWKDVFRGDPQRAVERMSKTQGLDALSGYTYSLAQHNERIEQATYLPAMN